LAPAGLAARFGTRARRDDVAGDRWFSVCYVFGWSPGPAVGCGHVVVVEAGGMLTARENLLRQIRREGAQWVPFEMGFTPAIQERFGRETGARSPSEYYHFPTRSVSAALPARPTNFAAFYDDLPPGDQLDEWGIGHIPGGYYHFTLMAHPMARFERLDQIEAFPFPDRTSPQRYAHFPRAVAEIQAAGYAADFFAGHIFETAWQLRGLERFLTDLVDHLDFCEYILDRITEGNAAGAAAFAAAGGDLLRTGDDVGTQHGMMFSPGLWRRVLKPRLARVIAAARAYQPELPVWYHSDGEISPVIDELIEIGVTILNPVQPECMDPGALKARYGDRLSFWGTIGTQSVMPFGSPAEVRDAVRHMIETVGAGGGLVIAPTHVLEPEVPWENICALVDAVTEYGAIRPGCSQVGAGGLGSGS
jgi:uroporphyrinogen decarboxylase